MRGSIVRGNQRRFISREDMIKYLNLLEIEVDGDDILVPSFRPDLNLMADVAEEVGRSYGYNEIPTTAFKTSTQGGYTPYMLAENQAGILCRGLGYSEIITYSFVSFLSCVTSAGCSPRLPLSPGRRLRP